MNSKPVGEISYVPGCSNDLNYWGIGSGILILVSLVALAAISFGLAVYGAQVGWWEAETLSHFNQTTAVALMVSGGGATALMLLLGSSMICMSTYLSKTTQNVITSTNSNEQSTNNFVTKSGTMIATQFPQMNGVFGKQQWHDYYGLDVEEPPVPNHIDAFLSGNPSIHASCTLFLMPENLKIAEFVNFAKKPNKGNAVNIDLGYNHPYLGAKVKNKSYWILVNRSFEGKGDASYSQAKTTVEQAGMVLPYFYEALFYLSTMFMTSGKKPQCSLYCEGIFEANTHLAIAFPENDTLRSRLLGQASAQAFGVLR